MAQTQQEYPQQPNRLRRLARAVIFLLALLALGLLFVDELRPPEGEPPAARLLPNLPAYRQVEGQTITAYVGALSEGAALLAGQPQLALTVGVLDGVIDCYQEVGGVRARVYSHAEQPLAAGLVAIVDEARINDPDNLFRCVTPAALSLEGTEEIVIEPCAATLTLVNDEGTFYVVYAGSTFNTCRDFCSALAGCQVHAGEF
jgi:hypothetical protein